MGGGEIKGVSCRVCLHISPHMHNIFSTETQYYKLLRECGRVQVEERDSLPPAICEGCLRDMLQAHHFAIKCQETDRKLRLSLKSNSIKTEDVKDIFSGGTPFLHIKQEYICDDVVEGCMDQDAFHLQNDVRLQNHQCTAESVRSSQSSKIKIQQINERCKRFPLKCSYCSLDVSSKSALKIHTRIHTNERPFSCEECSKNFRTKRSLQIHRLRCHNNKYNVMKTHKCGDCGKIFLSRIELLIHMRSHTGDTPYQCELCNSTFTQSPSLKRHVRAVHTKEKLNQCTKCAKSFAVLGELRNHQVVHSTERKYICDICKAAFKSKPTLKTHIRIHSSSKRFICDQCGLLCSTKGNLDIHRNRLHSEMAGQCSVCNKVFPNLKSHMTSHTGETPFHCETCGKRFSSKSSFIIHIQIHNVNKHPCQYQGCNKTFAKFNYLEYHVLKHHKKFTPYVCRYCDKGYFRLCDLTHHIKVNHPEEDYTYLEKVKIPSSFFTDVNI